MNYPFDDATTQELAFPWKDGRGLARAIDDVELWAFAVSDAAMKNADVVRRELKRLIKKHSTDTKHIVVSVDNDDSFGLGLKRLISSRQGRSNLFKHLTGCFEDSSGEQWIASRVFQYARRIGRAPDLDLIANKREDQKYYLDLQKFSAWIGKETAIDSEQGRVLAIVGCAFAILQPDLGTDIYSALALHSTETANWLTTAPTRLLLRTPRRRRKEKRSKRCRSGAHERANRPETRPLERATNAVSKPNLRPFHPEAPRNLQRQIIGWGDAASFGPALTLEEHRSITSLLKDTINHLALVVEELESQRAHHDVLRSHIIANLEEIKQLPWFHASLASHRVDAPDSTEALGSAVARIQTQYEQSSDLLSAHKHLMGLYATLEKTPERLPASEAKTLADATSILKLKAKENEEELSRIHNEERSVDSFFDALSQSTSTETITLIHEAKADLWRQVLAYVLGRPPITEPGQRHSKLKGDLELAGLIIGILWHQHKDAVYLTLNNPAARDKISNSHCFEQAFRYLDYGGLQELCLQFHEFTLFFGALLTAKAINCSRSAALEYIADFLDPSFLSPAIVGVLQELLRCSRQGDLAKVISSLRTRRSNANTHIKKEAAELKTSLLASISKSPGLKKNFHLLRIIAQAQFLKPLEPIIRNSEANDAYRQWKSYGGIDEMVESCVRASGKHRELDARHFSQTRRYLEAFQAALEEWSNLVEGIPTQASDKLASLISNEQDANSLERELLNLVLDTNGSVAHTFPGLAYIGEQLVTTCPDNELLLADAETLVDYFCLICWPRLVEGKPIRFVEFVADKLARSAAKTPMSQETAVTEYLSRREFKAAFEAAQGTDDLFDNVKECIEIERSVIKEKHAALLSEAAVARERDEFVDASFVEIEELLKNMQFHLAELRCEELEQAISEYRSQQDPAYQSLLNFLQDCDSRIDPGTSRADLEQRVDTIKTCEIDRRTHVLRLLDLANTTGLSPGTVSILKECAHDLDRPNKWLKADWSAMLSDAIANIAKYVSNRLQFRSDDAICDDMIVDSMCEWIRARTESCIQSEAGETEMLILQLAEDSEKIVSPGIPDHVVLGLIGGSARSQKTARDKETSVAKATGRTVVSPLAEASKKTPNIRFVKTRQLVAEVREALRPLMGKTRRSGDSRGDLLKLSRSLKSERWDEAMQVSASLFEKEDEFLDDDFLHSAEVAFSIAHTLATPPADSDEQSIRLRRMCLAIACSAPETYSNVIPADRIAHSISVAFIAIARQCASITYSSREVPDLLADAVGFLNSAPDHHPAYTWTNQLFIATAAVRCGTMDGSAILANGLWDGLTRRKDVARSRSDLLSLLYRLRRIPAIEALIKNASGQRREEIRLCLQTFVKMVSDPDLRLSAYTKFHALQEKAAGQGNTKPWLLFFGETLSQNQSEGEPLRCSLESDQVAFDDEEHGLIEVKFSPDPIDPPVELSVTLASIQSEKDAFIKFSLPLEDEPLLKPRVFSIKIPSSLLQDAGDVVRISTQIDGKTGFGRSVDFRDTWELPVSNERLQPIEPVLRDYSWPGATGRPVESQRGFYGREREIVAIESCINDPIRPRSVMVFGQRRIGKTSLLLEMVRDLPPAAGRACGVFVDVGGLAIPEIPGGMQTALFDCIVSAIDTKEVNARLSRRIQTNQGESSKLKRLTKHLSPHISLSDAMQELVNIVDARTNGSVKRLAVFIDEFDRFVEPLLSGKRDLVDQLMRGLKEIVQNSKSISLILSGSGLQRVLVDDYQAAFYGSIEELEISPFSIDTDRNAVAETLLPRSVGERLCPPNRRDVIIEHSHSLCGGHPYYLAMLGFSCAFVSRGHPLTPALINRVAERMVRGKVDGNITSMKFYGHIFESLKLLPKRDQYVAQILLAHIAGMTTQEYPIINRKEAVAAPELTGIDLSRRYQLLRALVDENAIEADDKSGSIQLRVPITAAALREDSDRIKHQAMSALETLPER